MNTLNLHPDKTYYLMKNGRSLYLGNFKYGTYTELIFSTGVNVSVTLLHCINEIEILNPICQLDKEIILNYDDVYCNGL